MSLAPRHDRKIEDIQALRGISILFVLLQHLSITAVLFAKFPHQVELPFYIGVEMFFLISGYVVTLALNKDQFRGGRFLIKRVFRLTPVLMLFVIFSYLVVLAVRSVVPVEFPFFAYFAPTDRGFLLKAAGVLGGFFILLTGPNSYQNAAMWSLSVEDQFYAAIALLCAVALLTKRLTRIPAKWWIFSVSAVLLVAVAWMRVRYFRGRVPAAVAPELFSYLFRWRFDFLAMGVLLALFDLAMPGWVRRHFRERGPFLTGFLLLLPLIVTAICESPFAPTKRLLIGLALPFILVSFSALVLLAANDCAFPSAKGPIYRALVWIGNRSYTYYVFHFPVLLLAWLICFRWIPSSFQSLQRQSLVQTALAIPMLVLLVEPIYRWIEMPLTRYGKRLVEGRKPADRSDAPEPLASSPEVPTRMAA